MSRFLKTGSGVRAALLSAAVLSLGAGQAMAWTETFNGGFDQTWFFADENGDPLPGGTLSTTGNYLTIDDTDDDYAPAAASGLVGVVFGDTVVTGDVNISNGGSNNDLGLLARAGAGSGYALAIDLGTGLLELSRIDTGVVNVLDSTAISGFAPSNSYYLSFSLTGSTLSGEVFDSFGGTSLGTVGAIDATYASGAAGIAASVNGDVIPTTLLSTFDNITATPEPGTVVLIGAGSLLLTYRRRKHA